jgi:hypothetical protein
MYTVTLNELKAVLKMSAQAGQRDAVNETSVEYQRPRMMTQEAHL